MIPGGKINLIKDNLNKTLHLRVNKDQPFHNAKIYLVGRIKMRMANQRKN